MAKSMTKSQIADYLAQKTGLTKKASVQLMDDFAALAYKEAKNVFVIPGLGKLVLANRKARMGRNPQTGEAIKIPAKRVLKFRVAKAAKDAILGLTWDHPVSEPTHQSTPEAKPLIDRLGRLYPEPPEIVDPESPAAG
ncbi:MAG: HU family DNA-binding protein [Nitrospira sp.]|nr:MAG: HU family DNA-binding protein [Nitrospira sp.]